MPRPFSPATAEQVVAAVEAVVVSRQPSTVEFVADFSDLPKDQAEAALKLAADLGLLSHNTGTYSAISPLSRFLVTPKLMQKAAVIRIILESYEPFVFLGKDLSPRTLLLQRQNRQKWFLIWMHTENR